MPTVEIDTATQPQFGGRTMMQKVLMASLTALLMLAPVALAENTNVGPGMTGTSSKSSAAVGTSSTTTTTKSASTKKHGKLGGIFNRLHRERQIRRFHRHMRRVRRNLNRR